MSGLDPRYACPHCGMPLDDEPDDDCDKASFRDQVELK